MFDQSFDIDMVVSAYTPKQLEAEIPCRLLVWCFHESNLSGAKKKR